MGEIKGIHIKNRTYYFYNDITDLKKFDVRLLKIYKKSSKNIGIYIVKKKIGDCQKFNSVNRFYLLINHSSGYIEENGVN